MGNPSPDRFMIILLSAILSLFAPQTFASNSHVFKALPADRGSPGTILPPLHRRHHQALEEIIVTAEKRSEPLIDVPMSIVAITGRELKQRDITSIDDLNFAVPGLAIDPQPLGQRRIEIRGISNIFGYNPTIGMYVDEADVTNAYGPDQLDIQTYDLSRVEVLRGPQGTLYGEGSMGGTIRFITNQPVLDRFQMNSDLTAMFTQNGAPGQRIEAVLNVPLETNTLGLRFAGVFEHDGGWVDFPAANLKNINGNNLTDVRLEELWKPLAHLTVSAMADVHRKYGGSNTWEDPNGNYSAVFNLTTPPETEDDFDIYNVTMTLDAEPVRILSATTYFDHDLRSWNFGDILPFAAPPAPAYEQYIPYIPTNDDNLIQELRLSSLGKGPLHWTVGGSYEHVNEWNSPYAYYFGLPTLSVASLPTPVQFYGETVFNEQAVFGDTSYALTDRLVLGAGVRDFEEHVRTDGYNGYCYPSCYSAQSGTFHSVNPRVYARYKVTTHANIYASAAKGFRGGGFNGLGQPPYRPESVWTYELGTKGSLPHQKLDIDADIFYSDYSDYVVLGEIPGYPENIYSNAGDARIDGVEWSVSWRPMEWNFDLSGYYLNKYNFTRIGTTNQSQYSVGDNLDGVPRYTYNASIQREFPLAGRPAFVRLDYSLRARATFRARNIGPWFFSEADVIHMLNVNTGLDWNDNLRLGFFVQNLLDDRAYIGTDAIQHYVARARPRTYGLDIGVNFD